MKEDHGFQLPPNPFLPGYYADPSLVQFEGRYFLYATIDPWGGNTLACWESEDFASWTYRRLNWPTKAACTSPNSMDSKVWAPSVIRALDGNFFMYVSVGSEIWVGSAPHPLGPWTNCLGNRPLIPSTWDERYHMIDAECFLDEDGRAYLYWGSGLNWVNGRCFAVELEADMITLKGEVRDVTPSRYFEAPFMHRRGDLYYLSYSSGRTDQDTYQVHCAVGTHPMGPFTEQENSPILATDASRGLISPGHHAIFRKDGEDYILYHRRIPYLKEVLREMCVDKIEYDGDGQIRKVEVRM
jgi:beta-xylosidase